jgi:acetoin utilization deacetylase AcuC-like enzyme
VRPVLFYTDHYTLPLPPGHKFPIEKYRKLRALLEETGKFELRPAPLADSQVVSLAHDPEYVARFVAGKLTAQELRRIGFPMSDGLHDRTFGSVGATLSATREALATGWGGTLAGGTHHAFYAEGSGFCIFNDIAVAIQKLRHEKQIIRAAVIDLDVHQGDGTAQIFANTPEVLTVSVHCKSNFPFRKQESKLDIELPDGTGDADYLRTFDSVLPRIFDFAPEVVFYQAGVDGLATDSLGHLALTHEGLLERDRRVLTAARNHEVPMVITLGGGYSKPIEHTVNAHANTYLTAAEVFA